MKPPPFIYHAPTSAMEALALLAEHGDEARLLAGGQSLMPLICLRMARPAVLVDLNRCEDLFYLREEGDWILSGPMTRQAAIEHSPVARRTCPLLAEVMVHVGHPTNRNRGTLGGSLAHADPSAELPGVATALDAEFIVEGPTGRRTVKPVDFFVDNLTTSIEPGEMLRELRFPKTSPLSRFAFAEHSLRPGGFAIAGIAVSLHLTAQGNCGSAILAATGVGPHPMRLAAAERALCGARIDEDTIREAAALSGKDIDPSSDLQVSADYRRRVMVGLVETALRRVMAAEKARP